MIISEQNMTMYLGHAGPALPPPPATNSWTPRAGEGSAVSVLSTRKGDGLWNLLLSPHLSVPVGLTGTHPLPRTSVPPAGPLGRTLQDTQIRVGGWVGKEQVADSNSRALPDIED